MAPVNIKPEDVVISEIKYDSEIKEKDTTKTIRISYKDEHSFNMRLPKMLVPFGLTDNKRFLKEPIDPKAIRYFFEVELNTEDPAIMKLKKLIEDIDDRNIQHLAANSLKIYGKTMTEDYIRENDKYKSSIAVSLDENKQKSTKYHDRLRISVPIFKGPGFQVFKDGAELNFYNPETNLIDWTWAQKRMTIIPMIQSEGLMISKLGSSGKWRLTGLLIKGYSNNRLDISQFEDEEIPRPMPELVSNDNLEVEDD